MASGKASGGRVLLTLAATQFLMTLDSSVMNVSMASIAADLGTSVTGIQTAIALYTLVVAALLITGSRVGRALGRRRVFVVGLVVFGSGALLTACAPNLAVLILGWSILEGIGAALILPAIVALIAVNFTADARPKVFGLVAVASAAAIAIGPVLGGFATSFLSWRYVFAGEVVLVTVIVLMAARLASSPPAGHVDHDVMGSVLSVVGLGLTVYGALRSTQWGWVAPKPGEPQLLGVSPATWLIAAGLVVLAVFWRWERRVERNGGDPLVSPSMLRNRQLNGGLVMFLCQYFVEGGAFFVVPVFLSVVLALSPFDTGLRILPLSLALIVAALMVPRKWKHSSPRRIVQVALGLIVSATVLLILAIEFDRDGALVSLTMVLFGLGMGALASQLGSITVSAVPDDRSEQVGGLQNTAANLGLSLGTAVAGSVLIAALTTTFASGIAQDSEVPAQLRVSMDTQLTDSRQFVSNASLQAQLDAQGVDPTVTDAILAQNTESQNRALQVSLALLALVTVASFLVTRRLPVVQPGDAVRAPRDPSAK